MKRELIIATCQFPVSADIKKNESSFASFIARPDGKIDQQLKRNVSGVLICTIDLNKQFVDPSRPWRRRVSKGILRSA